MWQVERSVVVEGKGCKWTVIIRLITTIIIVINVSLSTEIE